MLSKFNNKDQEQNVRSMNMIGQGTIIDGNLKTEGDIRIDGKINGTITISSKLAIGESGTITGDVIAKTATIEGKVNGKVMISELLFLRKTAVITGDIYTQKLVVEEGAQFNGACKMGAAASGSLPKFDNAGTGATVNR